MILGVPFVHHQCRRCFRTDGGGTTATFIASHTRLPQLLIFHLRERRNGGGRRLPRRYFSTSHPSPSGMQNQYTSGWLLAICSEFSSCPPYFISKDEVQKRKRLSFRRVTVSGTSNTSAATTGEEALDLEAAKGYTMTQLSDRMIEVFLHEKPRPEDWRRLLIFRDEWTKYSHHFYSRCQIRADTEEDSLLRQKLLQLARKVRKIDHEMERHVDLLTDVQQNPTDIDAVVARRRKDFTEDFFRHLNILSEVNDSLEDRDAITRLGAKCLSAVCAYDNAAENLEMLRVAQSKFDDILNSPSLDVACEKIKGLARSKALDSSLVLLINRSWAAAKESSTMKSAVKDIMYQIYRTAKSSLKSITPKEIKLLKYLLNITDPEERFSALASAFSPGNAHEDKENGFYSTPRELHKWIKIMLDAYQLNKEDTELREARNMAHPVVIQRLFILKETIEEEYLKRPEESKNVEQEE